MPPRRGVRVDPSMFINYTEYVPDSDTVTRSQGSQSTSNRRHAGQMANTLRTREQFVCANYSFGVSPEAVVSLEDPDFPVDWENVDVVFESSIPDDCPICLHPLRAPRIVRICALSHLFAFLRD
jgi:hypothetical protein